MNFLEKKFFIDSTSKTISSERNYIRKIDQIGLFSLSNHRKPLSKSAFKRQIRPCSGAESRQKMSPKRELRECIVVIVVVGTA